MYLVEARLRGELRVDREALREHQQVLRRQEDAAALRGLDEGLGLDEVRALPVVALELAPDASGQTAFEPGGKVGAKLSAELAERGVILRNVGDSLAFCPPMIITEAEIEALFAPLEDALNVSESWAKAEDLL